MKRFFTIFVAAVIVAGCGSGKIVVKKDEFKDATTVSMDYSFSSEEWMGVGGPMDASFYREIKDGKKEPVIITFNIRADDKVTELTPKVFVKAQNKYELVINGILIEGKSKTEMETEVEMEPDNTKSAFVDYTNSGIGTSKAYKGTAKSEVTTEHWKELKGNFTITPEAEKDILDSSEVLLRFYSGNKPITYKIEKGKLNKIKEFLKTDGSPKS